jgi:adenylylsulfate kinase-like enzyme
MLITPNFTHLSTFFQLHSGLAPLDSAVESLLLRQPTPTAPSVTLVLGLPGAGQALVAASLHSILGQQGVRPHVVLIPGEQSD